jgi:hypothetical protein
MKLRVEEFARGGIRHRSRPFESLEFLPREGRKWAEAQEEKQQPLDWQEKRSGSLISRPESIRGSTWEETIYIIRSGRKIPSAIRFGKKRGGYNWVSKEQAQEV